MTVAQARLAGVFLLLLLPTISGNAIAAGAGSETPDTRYQAARAALNAGLPATAENILAELCAAYPANADYWLAYGQSQLALGQPGAAVRALEQARQLAPTYLDVLQVLASAYRSVERNDDALAVYRAASSIAPAADWVVHGLAAAAGASLPTAERVDAAPSEPPPASPFATANAGGRWTYSAGFESTLTERDDTWQEGVVGVEYAWSRSTRLGLRAARSDRFDQHDTVLEIYGSAPLSQRVTLAARGIVSPTHRVRVEEGGTLEASFGLGQGLVLSAGGGRMTYDAGPSDLITTTLERYFSDYRLAYTATLVKPVRGEWTPAHRWAAGWYYSDDDYVNLSLAWGEETDETLLGAPSIAFDTWGAGINGRHWLNHNFAFDYACGYNGLKSNRGDHLDRTTFYLGVVLRH